MFEKNNSIKEILKEAKEKLSKDNALTSEKEEFNQKISKALDGNVLVLNKIYGSDSKDNIDQRSKKITEIVEHQSALLLNQEVSSGTESALLLSNEVHENEALILNKEVAGEGTLLLDNEYEGPYSDELKEIHREIDELKERSEEKDPFIERIEQLEEKQVTLFNKVDQAINEIQSKDPSEEIALKLDIFNNQINNEIDEKISKINDQNSIFEERLTQIESSSENLKNSIENLDFKIEELSNNLNESLNNNIQEQISQLEQSKVAQDEKINFKLKEYEQNIQNRFDVIEGQMKTSIDQLHKYLEEEKIRKEEEKKNDPEYQSNLRLNNIYKIIEMQISQSLVNNMSGQNSSPAMQFPTQVSQNTTPVQINKETEKSNEILDKLELLSQQLSSKVKIDDQGIKEMYNLTNSKIEKMQQKLESAVTENKNNRELIEYFKSYELKNLEGLNFDLTQVKQFDDLDQAKSFLETLIIKETQNWIKNNQKNIEEICKKIIYK
ncbi:MAG: hypothetical protein MRY23_04815 [Pelagibacteraceae bacterium]|nr:hypothetical protein [Pelagibacteraceae bacterium]MCI5079100.1 hypothetical protein [Pelagibacteraceae bacterium]